MNMHLKFHTNWLGCNVSGRLNSFFIVYIHITICTVNQSCYTILDLDFFLILLKT